MVNFHDKLNSLKCKINIEILSVFFGPNHGEGGSAGWSKNQLFPGFFLKAPLTTLLKILLITAQCTTALIQNDFQVFYMFSLDYWLMRLMR